MPKEKNKGWLEALLKLDDHATIFVDVIPDLDVWVGDVFNYIPRDVWSMSAQLIGPFYRSSKQLYCSMHSEGLEQEYELYKELFFAKVEASLSNLFNFSSPAKNKGTIRKVFSTLSEEVANQKYGAHSHVHRHSFYLLIQIAILDDDWSQQIFNAEKNALAPHIAKINDRSCLSVLYTGLLEVAYFDGHSSGLDWSVIQGLNIPDLHVEISLPLKTQTQVDLPFQSVSETAIRKKILKISALKSNVQLVDRLYTVNQGHPSAKSNLQSSQLY